MFFYELYDSVKELAHRAFPTEKQRFRESQSELRRSIREMNRRMTGAERKEQLIIESTRAEIKRQV